MLSKLRENFGRTASSLTYKFKHLVLDTPIEILIGAVAGAAIVGPISYETNKAKEAEIPIAFSEIESITARFTQQGQAVPSLTQFYAMNSDLTMKVFEASNEALRVGEDPALFARALQERMQGGDSDHALISDYTRRMPADASAALNTLSPVATAARDLNAVQNALESAWTESHVDHYRTEVYVVTVCSGSGNTRSCSPQTRTRQVYDYTVHSYSYHPAEGQRALRLLQDYRTNHSDIRVPERLHLATEVGSANLAVITRSMREMLDGELPSPAQALQYANTWARGSTFNVHLNDIYTQHRAIIEGAGAWEGAIGSARSDRYRTHSRSDSGPAAYRVVERAKDNASGLRRDAGAITGGIEHSARAAPALERQVDTFIRVALYGDEGNAHELRRDILRAAREIYNKNHENGFDVEPFSWPEVLLFTFLGLLGGAALGLGADRIVAMPSINEMLRREKPKKDRYKKQKDQPRPVPDPKRDGDPIRDLEAEWKRREKSAPKPVEAAPQKPDEKPAVDLDGGKKPRFKRRTIDL